MSPTSPSTVPPHSLNYVLGYAEGLAFRRRRRNQPTSDHFREEYERGIADAINGYPLRFDPEVCDMAQDAAG